MTPDPLILIILGAFVGFAVGMTGIGGGSLMTPFLLLLGIPTPVAIGTDLCYAAITKMSGVIAHHRNKNINWLIVFYMSLGSIPGVIFAIFLLQSISEHYALYTHYLTYIIGWMLIITAISIFLHNYFKTKYSMQTDSIENSNRKKNLIIYGICIGTGSIIGILVTLSSVGAGAIGTAALLFLFPAMLPTRLVGTEIAHAVPLTIIAGMGHLYLGTVDFNILILLLIGSIPGVFVSVQLTNKLPVKPFRYTLSFMLLCFGAYYLFS